MVVYRDAKRCLPTLRGYIVVLVFTESCSWVKLKKVTVCKLETSLGRIFVYNLQTFRGFCQVHFTILLQIRHENHFLLTSEHRQAKVSFLVFVCITATFIAQISSSENVSKRDAILAPVTKHGIT